MIRVKVSPHVTDPTTQAKILAAAVEERENLLRRVAPRARHAEAGGGYEMSAFLTCREIFGGEVVNLHSWDARYNGSSLGAAYLATYSVNMTTNGRAAPPWTPVTEDVIREEYATARGVVSRETSTAPYNVRDTRADERGNSQYSCTCDECWDRRELYDRENGLVPALAPSPEPLAPGEECDCDDCSARPECRGSDDDAHDACDNHGCEECYGIDYSCGDHDCDHCFGSHYVTSCCGYCDECSSHPGSSDDEEVCPNCSYCRNCEHDCDNY